MWRIAMRPKRILLILSIIVLVSADQLCNGYAELCDRSYGVVFRNGAVLTLERNFHRCSWFGLLLFIRCLHLCRSTLRRNKTARRRNTFIAKPRSSCPNSCPWGYYRIVPHVLYIVLPSCWVALIVDLMEVHSFHIYKMSNRGWTQIPMKVRVILRC